MRPSRRAPVSSAAGNGSQASRYQRVKLPASRSQPEIARARRAEGWNARVTSMRVENRYHPMSTIPSSVRLHRFQSVSSPSNRRLSSRFPVAGARRIDQVARRNDEGKRAELPGIPSCFPTSRGFPSGDRRVRLWAARGRATTGGGDAAARGPSKLMERRRFRGSDLGPPRARLRPTRVRGRVLPPANRSSREPSGKCVDSPGIRREDWSPDWCVA